MIAIVSSSHYPDDERIYQKQICSLLEAGKKVVYYTKSLGKNNLSNENLIHINFDINLSIKVFIKKVFDDLLIRKFVYQIQIHETELLPLLKSIKKIKSNIFTIYDVHEDMNALYRTFSNRIFIIKELAILKRNFYERKNLKFVDQIILANPPIQKMNYEKLNIPILVLENYVEKKYIKKEPKIHKKANLIYHGHLGPERGIEDLVLAMHETVKKYSTTKLILLGSFRLKNFENKIKELITNLSLDKNIKIINQVSYKSVWEILRKNSIGIIPFRKNPLTENCTPTKLFEMMASYHHIVATDLPPVRYFVNDSIYWAEPDNVNSLKNAIISSIKSLEDNSKIKKNIKLIKNQYNWDLIKNNYIKLFL